MATVFLLVSGLAAYSVYRAFSKDTEPQPKDGNKSGTSLPTPRMLYSEPRLWTSAPVDVTYRNYNSYTGPNNDPRRAYLLYGGARVPHSGYDPVVQTNQAWPQTSPQEPASRPSYTAQPVIGIGEKQRVTSKTVFV